MDKAKLVADVRQWLDEVELKSGVKFEDEDSLPIEDKIMAFYPHAWGVTMYSVANRYKTRVNVGDAEIEPDLQKGVGRITVPDDFLCLVSLKMRGWKKAVTGTIGEGSDRYRIQQNYAMRGGIYNPVVALVDGGEYLEYYSLPRYYTKHEIQSFAYCPTAKDVETDEVTDGAYKVLVLTLAQEVASSMGRNTSLLVEMIKQELNTYGN